MECKDAVIRSKRRKEGKEGKGKEVKRGWENEFDERIAGYIYNLPGVAQVAR
jgi:hypothetical protein